MTGPEYLTLEDAVREFLKEYRQVEGGMGRWEKRPKGFQMAEGFDLAMTVRSVEHDLRPGKFTTIVELGDDIYLSFPYGKVRDWEPRPHDVLWVSGRIQTATQ